MDELKTRRIATVIKLGTSSALTLTDELQILGVNGGEEVFVTVRDGRIEIEKVKR